MNFVYIPQCVDSSTFDISEFQKGIASSVNIIEKNDSILDKNNPYILKIIKLRSGSVDIIIQCCPGFTCSGIITSDKVFITGWDSSFPVSGRDELFEEKKFLVFNKKIATPILIGNGNGVEIFDIEVLSKKLKFFKNLLFFEGEKDVYTLTLPENIYCDIEEISYFFEILFDEKEWSPFHFYKYLKFIDYFTVSVDDLPLSIRYLPKNKIEDVFEDKSSYESNINSLSELLIKMSLFYCIFIIEKGKISTMSHDIKFGCSELFSKASEYRKKVEEFLNTKNDDGKSYFRKYIVCILS